MKIILYSSLCLVFCSIAFVFGRVTAPGWPYMKDFAAQCKADGRSAKDVLEQINSINNCMELGDQLAAVTSAQALRQIEENKVDNARKILATSAAHFYNQYQSSTNIQSQRTIALIKKTSSISPHLREKIVKEAEQGAAANP